MFGRSQTHTEVSQYSIGVPRIGIKEKQRILQSHPRNASLRNLSSPKPGHTTGGLVRGAQRGGGAGSGRPGCQQNCSPRKRVSFVPSTASRKHRLIVSPEARASEILCKPMEERNPRLTTGLSAVDKQSITGSSVVYPRFISRAGSALSYRLLNSGPTPFCLCKPFLCKACPGLFLHGCSNCMWATQRRSSICFARRRLKELASGNLNDMEHVLSTPRQGAVCPRYWCKFSRKLLAYVESACKQSRPDLKEIFSRKLSTYSKENQVSGDVKMQLVCHRFPARSQSRTGRNLAQESILMQKSIKGPSPRKEDACPGKNA